MKKLAFALLVLSLAACRGKGGAAGPDGVVGPPGPDGPLTLAPRILDVTPSLASPASTVRLRVENVAGTPAVFFDDQPATIVSTTASEIWVRGVPANVSGFTEVRVEANGVRSEAIPLAVGVHGDSRFLYQGGLDQIFDSLALDVDGQKILIADGSSGLLRFDPATGLLSTVAPAGSVYGNPRGIALLGGAIAVADQYAHRISRLEADGSFTAIATGLAANVYGLVSDTDGSLYWTDGDDGNIGRRAPDGTITDVFATVPNPASGITRVGTTLYVADNTGAIHSIALPGGAVTPGFVTGLGDVRGLSTDGTDVYGCVGDSGSRSAVKVTTSGTVTTAAPAHAVARSASNGCLITGATIWTTATLDGALESSTAGAAWQLRAPALGADSETAIWAGDRLFVASSLRCPGDSGAIAEILGPGTQQTIATDACAASSLALDSVSLPTGLYWADTRGTTVKRFDLGSSVISTVVSDASTLTAASGLAVSIDGKFFVGVPGGSPRVIQYSAQGALLNAAVGGAAINGDPQALAVANTGLYVALPSKIVRFDIDGTGNAINAATVAGSGQQLSGFVSVAPDGNEGVYFAAFAGTKAFSLDAQGGIHYLMDVNDATGVGRTPFGDLLETSLSSFPIARLQ